MTNEELKTKYSELLQATLFSVFDVRNVNHKPHCYMVGPKHVAYASDHCGGMLGEEVCRKIKCAQRGCTTAYADHVSDRVLILSLTRNASQDEAREILKSLADTMTADGLDGVAFVKSAFSFLKDEEEAKAC